mmetsp:Transcript_9307/g.26893  ORF Transcript_9307/g.26893 Transcript_9307/m.26893 type:complete len:237 (-) Transcript_9307:201-911(-)
MSAFDSTSLYLGSVGSSANSWFSKRAPNRSSWTLMVFLTFSSLSSSSISSSDSALRAAFPRSFRFSANLAFFVLRVTFSSPSFVVFARDLFFLKLCASPLPRMTFSSIMSSSSSAFVFASSSSSTDPCFFFLDFFLFSTMVSSSSSRTLSKSKFASGSCAKNGSSNPLASSSAPAANSSSSSSSPSPFFSLSFFFFAANFFSRRSRWRLSSAVSFCPSVPSFFFFFILVPKSSNPA